MRHSEVKRMNIRKVLCCIGLFVFIALFGWGFVEIMSTFTWMVDKMDYLLWAIIYLAGVIGVCTFLFCNSIKDNS